MIKLFVVGFPLDIDEVQLAQLFGPYGDVLSVAIARDKVSGKRKGFGFIEMDDEGASLAIASLNGHQLGERRLEVKIAEEKGLSTKENLPFKSRSDPKPVNPIIKAKRPRIRKD